ncbi:Pectinesterase inhibitor [Corchorus capsularis]|uniref:Pectinesterase inhibitor n=1 Tax=Corchorus capsularis TaxID=210143 RepID=A0A1R3I7J0_COCAP|nr:Pectinesterase inhibitor [Corchorus capsularis]
MAMATTACSQELAEVVQMARAMVLQSRNSAKASVTLQGLDHGTLNYHGMGHLSDCVKLYDDSEYRLSLLLYNEGGYTIDDARTWLSGVMANHRTCLEGLGEHRFGIQDYSQAQNLTSLLSQALALCGKDVGTKQGLYKESFGFLRLVCHSGLKYNGFIMF